MHKGRALLFTVLAISGCVQQQPSTPPLDVAKIHPTPVCSGEQQCSEMWGRAIRSLPTISRMRLMTATDTYLQTFPAGKVGYLNGAAYKQKLPDGRYSITATFDCRGRSWCSDLSNRALDLFNTEVQGFTK